MTDAKIMFLGTAGDATVVGKQLRASGGIIVQSDDNQLHIDPGPGSLVLAKVFDINIRNNTAVLVSHSHLGHSNDANAVLHAMSLGGIDPKGVIIAHKGIIEGDEEHKAIVSDFHKKCVERCIEIAHGQRVGINNLEIVSVPCMHNDGTAMGFKIFTPYFVLGYTGDTEYTDQLAYDLRNVDILILNVTYPGNQKGAGHLCTEDASKLVDAVKPRLAIITHFGVKMLQADPINEAREIQRATKVQTVAAQDGFSINPKSYAVNVNQRK